MSNVNKVVIYSPVEDALYNQGMLIPLAGSAGAGILVFLMLMKLASNWMNKTRSTFWPDVVMAVAALAACGVAFVVFNHLAL